MPTETKQRNPHQICKRLRLVISFRRNLAVVKRTPDGRARTTFIEAKKQLLGRGTADQELHSIQQAAVRDA